MDGSTLVGHVGLTAILHAASRLRRQRFLMYRCIKPGVEIRVVMSALLRLQAGGRYLLVRNLHRPETFAPFGGVIKYNSDAGRTLDRLQFRCQDLGPGPDMSNDLRGFILRRNLASFMAWYDSNEERETVADCLRRELAEELLEVGREGLLAGRDLRFRVVRTIDEGPIKPPGVAYLQFRVFTVCDLVANDGAVGLLKELFAASSGHSDLVTVSSDELLSGRAADGRVVASTAAYLIRPRRERPDEPPIVRMSDSAGLMDKHVNAVAP